ncbi:MAG: hypothetical protein KIS94_09125 [Chitinophagales bacterium]|nr:hypothetical protein [Chitinophagales bacterium]
MKNKATVSQRAYNNSLAAYGNPNCNCQPCNCKNCECTNCTCGDSCNCGSNCNC